MKSPYLSTLFDPSVANIYVFLTCPILIKYMNQILHFTILTLLCPHPSLTLSHTPTIYTAHTHYAHKAHIHTHIHAQAHTHARTPERVRRTYVHT